MDVRPVRQNQAWAVSEGLEAGIEAFQYLEFRLRSSAVSSCLDSLAKFHLCHRLDDVQGIVPGKNALFDQDVHESLDELRVNLPAGKFTGRACEVGIRAGIIC